MPMILLYRRMFAALRSLRSASRLAHSICIGREPNQGQQYLNNYRARRTFIVFVVIVVIDIMCTFGIAIS